MLRLEERECNTQVLVSFVFDLSVSLELASEGGAVRVDS